MAEEREERGSKAISKYPLRHLTFPGISDTPDL